MKFINKNNMYDIDFIWSSQKEYFSLKPLYLESKNVGLNTRLLKIHRNKIRNYIKISNLSDPKSNAIIPTPNESPGPNSATTLGKQFNLLFFARTICLIQIE